LSYQTLAGSQVKYGRRQSRYSQTVSVPLPKLSIIAFKTNANSFLAVVEDRRPEYERREAEKRRAEGKPVKRLSPMEAYGLGGINPNALQSRI